jgi:uncharacterized protein YjbK
MSKELTAEFKTLLTKEEYNRLYEKMKDHPGNLQTNYYFDTKRYTLKATDTVLRVKWRDGYTLTLERKKGYNFIRIDEEMTEEEFKDLVENGIIHNEKIANEVNDIIKGQKILNFMNLATYRISVPYKKGKLSLDRCEYVNTVDYELEYEVSNRNTGKLEFVQIIKDYNIAYKKSQVKLKRAYDALRKTL